MNFIRAALIMIMGAGMAHSAEVTVLSGGAVEPGLHAFAALAKRETGHDLRIQFNTGPQIAKRLAANEVYDILISPPPALELSIKEGKVVAETRVAVGRVGAGIIVRAGVTPPDVSSVEALKKALLAADAVVYNQASTGIYLDKLFAGWGILEQLKPKTARHANGESVMEHVIRGSGNQIGFGAITEIKLFVPKGLQYVGPLPAEVQNYTSYQAVVMNGAANAEAARAVLKLLASPAGKAAFVSGGVE